MTDELEEFRRVAEEVLRAEGEEALQRLEEKGRMLASAGVLFPSADSWEDRELAILMMADISPSYPGGVSPRGGSTDSPAPGKCRL